jgi:phosphomannomutase/phosphoglucomutase
MSRLKEIVLKDQSVTRAGGGYVRATGVAEAYMADISKGANISRSLKVVAACGNGTAGAFAPTVLKALGADVIEMDCELDHTFPNYNPNPEDLAMLHAVSKRVLETGADIGLCFDGDGDRCGVVDNTGDEIFADKVGLMLARDLSANFENSQFVVDVKSTGLYATDPVLSANKAQTEYWKTGHSYIKRRANELKALAGFEKSGHYFLQPPLGRGYDDALVSARVILEMLDRNPGKSMANLKDDLPVSFGSPTMSPLCSDEEKYDVVDRIITNFETRMAGGELVAGRPIIELNTVNGVRFALEDGAWGLVRASSNSPNLVIVVESLTSEDDMRAIFEEIKSELGKHPEIGVFDQEL